MIFRTTALLCPGLIALALTGCKTAPAPEAPTSGSSAGPGAFEPIDATRLMPDAPMAGAYVVAAGDDEGERQPFTLTPTDEGWTLTEEGQSEAIFVRGDGGAVALSRDVNQQQDAAVWYEQPLTVLPAKLTREATVTTESPTRVTNAQGKGQKAAGTTTLRITNIWQASVETPAGTFDDAYHVRQERDMDLGLAKVHIVIDTAYVPGLGPVAEETWRTEQVLIGKKQKHSRVELAELPKPQ